MKKTTLGGLALTAGLLASANAAANEQLVVSETTEYKIDMAQSLQQQLLDPAFKQKLLSQLSETKAPILFSNAMANKLSKNNLHMLDVASTQGIYPEIWLHAPKAASTSDAEGLVIAYVPAGDEDEWKFIPAIDAATGESLQLEVDQAPDRPVLVVETHGSYSMQHFISDLNVRLSGLTYELSKEVDLSKQAQSGNVETTKLTKISLKNDQEPWIKGAAEIFTFVAGVFDNNNPAIKAVGLPYLDYDNTNYYPNQLIINWNDYNYNAVNFSMYEEDSGTNYKELAKVIVTAVGAIGSLAGFEPATAIAQITNRIQDAMPDSWYTDDHDYVDTCYTIVKGESLNDQYCAAGNARISTSPFTLQSN